LAKKNRCFCDLDEYSGEKFQRRNETKRGSSQKLVVKMIPQMHSEEIITEDFDKNIFYGN
jgi:hypothetical protein